MDAIEYERISYTFEGCHPMWMPTIALPERLKYRVHINRRMSVLNLLTIAARNKLLRVAIQADAAKSRGRPRALSTIEACSDLAYFCAIFFHSADLEST